jgi:uroporphyrinogen-III synthase
LDNLATMLGGGGVDLLQNTPVAVIGERLAAHARALGCRRLDVATEASDEGLCDAVVRLANSTRG